MKGRFNGSLVLSKMQNKPITLPWSIRWRRIRAHVMPVLVFLLAVVACGWLWQQRGAAVHTLGEVEALRVNITSPADGVILALPHETRGQWTVYDHVRAGDVIARLSRPSASTSRVVGEGVAEAEAEPTVVEIRAPISGTLVALYCWPGQSVPPGGLIATIAADHGRHIVSYLPEENAIDVTPGMSVTLRARSVAAPRLTSVVEQVGQQIESIPAHQLAYASSPQWGLPVRIELPPDSALRPGALVDVVFHVVESTDAE
jgi:multidrug resistance efflux pump